MSKRRCLIVFDIDETLIQFVGKKYAALFNKRKNAFSDEQYIVDKENIIIFRPGLAELMAYLDKNKAFFKVALWTLSDCEYCDGIAKTIIKQFNLPKNFFMDKKADTHNEAAAHTKDLSVFWDEHPTEFNKFNTVLVDDRFENMNNPSNRYNGIAVKPFAPFGTEKVREHISDDQFQAEIDDSILMELIDVLEKLKKDIKGCDEEDIEISFRTEPIASQKRMKRMGLMPYYQKFPVSRVEKIFRIGMPYIPKVKEDGSTTHGGRKNRQSKRRKTLKKRRKTHRRR